MTGTIVILDWSSQAPYPLYRSMLVKEPLVIRPNSNLLISPNRDPHPLWRKLSLVLTILFANVMLFVSGMEYFRRITRNYIFFQLSSTSYRVLMVELLPEKSIDWDVLACLYQEFGKGTKYCSLTSL